MPSELDKLALWNLALDHVVEKPLATCSDSNAYARWLNRQYDHARDLFLRLYPWNFAIQYNSLTVDATAPDFRWSYRYALPEEYLRVLPPTYLGLRGGNPVAHEVIAGWILCDVTPTLHLRTIQRVEDLDLWDQLALDALALFLAYRMTYRFTGLATHRDRLKEEFADAIRMAYETNTLETTPEPIEQHTVLDVRDA